MGGQVGVTQFITGADAERFAQTLVGRGIQGSGDGLGGITEINGLVTQYRQSTIDTRRNVTTQSISTRVNTSRTDALLGSEIIPFMRPIAININGQRFRPWAKVTPYFNGVDISANVVPNPLVADALGTVTGIFYVPVNTFRVGSGLIVLTDDPEPANAISFGSAQFSSSGVRETRQATQITTNTTVITNSTQTVGSQELAFEVTQFQPAPPAFSGGDGGGDPLAQTFFVNTKTTSPGCFITKIDLWFADKDPTQPIELELRDVVNGYPGGNVIANKILPPASVPLSTNASAVTTFEFDRPQFVENGKQYSFVLKTNSTRYEAWVAEMGQNRVDANESVAKQPNAGVMFISSNDSSWTPVQLADIKFKIHVAKFSTTPATIVTAPAFPQYKTAFDVNIELANGTKEIRVFAIQHGLQIGSTSLINVELPGGITTIAGIALSDVNGIKTITKQDSISFTFEASGATVASSGGMFKVASIQFEPNAVMDAFTLVEDSTILANTTIANQFKSISGKSADGSQIPFVQDSSWQDITNRRVSNYGQPKLVASYNETLSRYAGVASTKFKTVMSTIDPFVSPFIKTENSGIIAITNYMNDPSSGNLGADYVAETSASTGMNQCRYVTKPVTLSNPASSLKVAYAANCVTGNAIDVYYRVIGSGDSASIMSKPWVLFAPVSPFINAQDASTFHDYSYDVSGLPEYITVQVKLVLRGTNSAIPPAVKDLRILALAV